jgi:hypothetical protein
MQSEIQTATRCSKQDTDGISNTSISTIFEPNQDRDKTLIVIEDGLDISSITGNKDLGNGDTNAT